MVLGVTLFQGGGLLLLLLFCLAGGTAAASDLGAASGARLLSPAGVGAATLEAGVVGAGRLDALGLAGWDDAGPFMFPSSCSKSTVFGRLRACSAAEISAGAVACSAGNAAMSHCRASWRSGVHLEAGLARVLESAGLLQ